MSFSLLTDPKTMSHHAPNLEHAFLTRRQMLSRLGMGMGTLALGEMLGAGKPSSGLNSTNPFNGRMDKKKQTIG